MAAVPSSFLERIEIFARHERHACPNLLRDLQSELWRGDLIERNSHGPAQHASIKCGDPFYAVAPQHHAIALLYGETLEFPRDLRCGFREMGICPSDCAVSLPLHERDIAMYWRNSSTYSARDARGMRQIATKIGARPREFWRRPHVAYRFRT